ncbi:MAG: secretin N-terminal domain-containing protein [Candidatus Omnitrophota bacterium]|nr:secretin N-terminal domain-containing protein [Candidatus Omnitrophota bacterium]
MKINGATLAIGIGGVLLLLIGSPGKGWGQEEEPAAAQEERLPGHEELEAEINELEQRLGISGGETREEPAAGVTVATPGAASGLVSVDFKDADIRQVLRILSLKSGVDIVAGSDVEGLVTIKLTDVPWEQALDIVLRTYGFAYERKGKIIRVMSTAALEQEALSTEVFPLGYAKAKEVPEVVKEMLSDRGKVKFDERTNTVIVTDIPTSLFQIKAIIERLDQRTPQVSIEAKVVETKLTKDESLGVDWSDSITFTVSPATAPTTFPFRGGAELGAVGSSLIPRPGAFSPTGGASLTKGRIPETGGQFTFGTLTSSSLATILNFLESRTDTHIVSNPNILVLNNQEAKIHIGEEYPVPQYSLDPSTGRTSISGYTPKLTGTVLTVTPHVNPNLEIVVDLKPEIIAVGTEVTYSLGTSSGSVSFPRFTTQTAQTQVRIQNGQTIALGGLVKTNDTKVVTKVPVLGDIPILGLLFKNTRWYSGGSDPVRQDLLIFLTVRLMEEGTGFQQAVAAAQEPPAYE